jgi:general L-amino acid transport system ATP-binding protein
MSVVSFSAVNKWFGPLHVLRDIDLVIERGERLVVCGPSGSGKSTLIRLINGLEPFQAGRLDVLGNDMSHAEGVGRARRQVGMVFQSFNLFTHLTVLDNLTLAPETALGMPPAEAEARAHALLARVGLAAYAASFPGRLSGGQQQRVAIARTLMMEPEILLFDEPTSALDPEMVGEVLSLMESLAEDGTTMICVTHEMGFAARVADRVLFMAEGSLVEQAPPSIFFASPRSARAKAFIEQVI